MTAISQLRGHSIYWDRDRWRYTDNNAATLGNERDCGRCGHGIAKEAYVQFPDGADVRGDAALAEIDRMIKEREASITDYHSITRGDGPAQASDSPVRQPTECDWCGEEFPDDLLQNETQSGDAICNDCADEEQRNTYGGPM